MFLWWLERVRGLDPPPNALPVSGRTAEIVLAKSDR